MLSRLKIGARLGVAFGSLVILLAAANGVGLHGLNAQKATADDLLNVDVAVLQNAAEVRRLTLEERSLEKDIFINVTNHEAVLAFKKSWDEANNQLLSKLEEGAKLAPGDELRQLYEESSKQLIAYNNGFAAVYTRIEAGEISHPAIADMVFGQYKDEVHQLDQLAADINQSAVAHIDGMDQDFAREYHIALIGQLVFSGLTLLIAAFLAVRITRSITRPLQQALEATRLVADGDLTQVVSGNPHDETGQLLDAMGETNRKLSGLVVSLHRSSDQVFDGAHHVLLGSQELAARTDEQVAALQQTASSMEQITALVQQNSASTEQANQLAGVAARAAQSGGQEVEQSVRLMQEIAASSQRINDIVKVIDGIAFQTNILALNASVEAARAGEHGRGFSVDPGQPQRRIGQGNPHADRGNPQQDRPRRAPGRTQRAGHQRHRDLDRTALGADAGDRRRHPRTERRHRPDQRRHQPAGQHHPPERHPGRAVAQRRRGPGAAVRADAAAGRHLQDRCAGAARRPPIREGRRAAARPTGRAGARRGMGRVLSGPPPRRPRAHASAQPAAKRYSTPAPPSPRVLQLPSRRRGDGGPGR